MSSIPRKTRKVKDAKEKEKEKVKKPHSSSGERRGEKAKIRKRRVLLPSGAADHTEEEMMAVPRLLYADAADSAEDAEAESGAVSSKTPLQPITPAPSPPLTHQSIRGGSHSPARALLSNSKLRGSPLAQGAVASCGASSVSSYDGGASSSRSPRPSNELSVPLSPRKLHTDELRRVQHMSLEDIIEYLRMAIRDEEASERGEDTSNSMLNAS